MDLNGTPTPSLTSWMIGGGDRPASPAMARDAAHRRALAAARTGSPGIIRRIAAAATSAVRPAPRLATPACCAA